MYLINRLFQILREDGFTQLFIKSINRLSAIQKSKKINFNDESLRWKKLKDKYKGERVFLIGNGPSINKTPLYLLADEYKMCFNHFSVMLERLNWHPEFFLTSDNLVLSDIIKDFSNIIPLTKYSFFPGVHFRGDNYIKEIEKYKNAFWTIHLHGKGFTDDLPKIYPGGSVIYEGIQILKYLGFNEIYLIGVDMNYRIHKSAKLINSKGIDIQSQNNDDPNHFDPRYFGKGKKYHQPKKYVIENTIKDLSYIADKITNNDFRIINIGFDSKLDVFPKEEFSSVVNKTDALQKEIFNSLLIQISNTQCTDTIAIEDFPKLPNDELFHTKVGPFKCREEIALILINKAIFSHIPIGPYKNCYYFLERKNAIS
jgi:hypothetical protein